MTQPVWKGDSVIGIDPSTKLLGVVFLPTSGLGAKSVVINLGREAFHPGKLLRVYEQLSSFLGTLPPNHKPYVFLEAPVVGRGGASTTVVQSYVSGVIQLVTQQSNLPCQTVNNSAWKKVVVGHGATKTSRDKADVAASLQWKWAITYPSLATVPGITDGTASQDIADAAGLAVYGLCTLGRRIKLVNPSGVRRRRRAVLE